MTSLRKLVVVLVLALCLSLGAASNAYACGTTGGTCPCPTHPIC